MNKLNQKRIFLIIIAVIIVILIAILVGYFFLKDQKEENPNNEPINSNEIIQEVEPEEAEGMYQELTQNCTGALVWNLEVGDKTAITDLSTTEACRNEDYYSKMIGYTYNDLGVVLHVNVLKRTGNSVYKLDDTYVGEYDENNIDTLLESGTTYEYTFVQKEDRYELTEVSLMPVE